MRRYRIQQIELVTRLCLTGCAVMPRKFQVNREKETPRERGFFLFVAKTLETAEGLRLLPELEFFYFTG